MHFAAVTIVANGLFIPPPLPSYLDALLPLCDAAAACLPHQTCMNRWMDGKQDEEWGPRSRPQQTPLTATTTTTTTRRRA